VISLAIVYLGLLVLGPLFAWLERRSPERAPPVGPRPRTLDVLYWLVVTPLVTGTLTRAATIGAIGVIAQLTASRAPDGFLAELRAASPLGGLPLLFALPIAMVVADTVGYFSHRIRHHGLFWKFHAIHHSAETLDARAAARMHPIDDMIDNVFVGGAILSLGFANEVFLALGPILLLHTLLTHANLRWDFGPLRFVLVSPAFHRWHHARDRAGARGCNYAGMFSLLDLIFGTFHLPKDEAPRAFGADAPIPETILAQLSWPLRALWRELRAARSARR
jgi:sterol desaturase/sphingolipid hydroxylase (fatty acid hydroxylase superfamily)